MRIGIVIERFDPSAGGAERSTAQIAAELTGRGHNVTILAGSSPVAPLHQGVNVQEMLPGGRFKTTAHVKQFETWVRKILGSGKFDTSLSVTTNAPASVLQPRGGTAAEVHLRNIAARPPGWERTIKKLSALFSPKHWAIRLAEKRTLRDPMVQRFVCVSNYVTRQLAEHYGIQGPNVIVIPNAAAMPFMDDESRKHARTELRSEFKLADSDVAFLFAAYNPRLKGIDTLIRAVAHRKAKSGRAVALCAGEFGRRERKLAESLGVSDRVIDVGADRKMAELYVAADVTVLPTYYDPSSKVVIESLMMGTPAISTLYNGASDMIFERGSGITRGRVIADPWDDRALALAMADLENDSERQICGKACQGLADKLSMKRHVDRLEEVLRETCTV
jgi:UDP-glucose:(heptosyl)LPS alpha-1,3-glucosyltransferase